MIILYTTILILFISKAFIFICINDYFNITECIHSITAFKSSKYFVNYSRKERNCIRLNNIINFLLIATILGCMIIAFYKLTT